MDKVIHEKHIAFKCMECGMVNVFPNSTTDGHRCIECGGCIGSIGHARVYKKRNNSIKIGVNVDTTQLDEALEKAERLYEVFCEINSTPPIK